MEKTNNCTITLRKKIFPRNDNERELREVVLTGNGKITHGGKVYVNFSSNDYLALSGHPEIKKAFLSGAEQCVGSCSSRLMTGSSLSHHRLEAKVARFMQKSSALIFNSGYQANVGIIPALAGRGDCIFADKLSHASIIDGMRLSGAKCFRYRHNDTEHLSDLVNRYRKNFRKALIVTESVFSMDGDESPLRDIIGIKRKNDCMFMLDEAHSIGVFGEGGRGVSFEQQLSREIDIIVGTFSKALGVFGAFAAIDDEAKQLLINRCRSFIYTTSLPPAVIDACSTAIDVSIDEEWRRAKLAVLVKRLREELKFAGIPQGRSTIIPIPVGENLKALELANALKKRGWWVTAVRPPTVPEGKARIRLSATIDHSDDMINALVRDIRELRTGEFVWCPKSTKR